MDVSLLIAEPLSELHFLANKALASPGPKSNMAGIEIERIFGDPQHLAQRQSPGREVDDSLILWATCPLVCSLRLQRLREHKQKKKKKLAYLQYFCTTNTALCLLCTPGDIIQLIQANCICWSVILMLSAARPLCVKGISATVPDA